MALAVACLAGASPAQERTVRRVGDGRGDTKIQKMSVLMKSKVLIQEDQPAGQIVDIVLSDGGCVEYLVATHEQKYYAIPFAATTVRYPDQVVFIDMAPAQFRKVQFFQQDSWPDLYAANYRDEVFAVFNVNVRNRNDNPDRDRPDRNPPDRDRPGRGDRDNDRPGREPGAPRDRTDGDRPTDRNRDDRSTDPARPRPTPQTPPTDRKPGDAPADPPRPSPDASDRDAAKPPRPEAKPAKPEPPKATAPKPPRPEEPKPAPKEE